LPLTALNTVDSARLQRAVNALTENTLAITLTRQTEAEIRALVKNGEGKEHGVTIMSGAIVCSCKDAMYRAVVCKHVVALSLSVILQPQPTALPTVKKESNQPNFRVAKVRPS